jgi:hypothetical protein
MNILINAILAFYPATLIWNALPHTFVEKIGSASASGGGRFFSLAILYAVIFVAVYWVVKRFTTTAYLGNQMWVKVLTVISVVILFLFVFYTLLPGGVIYPSPSWLNHYLLQDPYNFIAILIPLIVLFLY